jgi:hypothetical protein
MAIVGRKSLRQFHCTEALWKTFARMAAEQDKDVDELIGDAMVAYAQLAGYQTGIDVVDDGPETPPPARPPARSPAGRPTPPPPAARVARPIPAPGSSRPSGTAGSGLQMMMQPTPPPPPVHPAALSPDVGPAGSAPPLYLVFDNQKYRIDKDQFIIGRGAKSSDLPIKDGNISRKHAAVVRRNGTYFIKDLGSTNGIDFKGMRIDNKRIDEGDVFHLCDYELRFTYKR